MKRGVLWSQYHSMSYSHKNSHIETSLNAFEDSFKILKKIVMNNKNIENYLHGKPCETVFTRVADFQSVATSQKLKIRWNIISKVFNSFDSYNYFNY